MIPSAKSHLLPALSSAIVAILLYAITLGGTYIYDDIPIVRDDTRVHRPAEWGQLWTRDYFNGGTDNLYRPVVSSSYAIEWFVHGDRPWVFHLINVLLHAGVAAAVAEFTRRGLGGSRSAMPAATIAGLLFAAHPLHVEAVANIVGRAELACALAVFAGLILLARRPLTTARVIAILGCGIVGMLCKEQGVLAPLLWVVFVFLVLSRGMLPSVFQTSFEDEEYFAQRRREKSRDPETTSKIAEPAVQISSLRLFFPLRLCANFLSRKRGLEKPSVPPESVYNDQKSRKLLAVLTVWVWAGYLIGREHFLKFDWDTSWLDPMRQPLLRSFGIDRILMPIVLVGHYTALFVWPAHLSLDYGGDVIGWHARLADPYLWIGIVAIVGWCVAIVLVRGGLMDRKESPPGAAHGLEAHASQERITSRGLDVGGGILPTDTRKMPATRGLEARATGFILFCLIAMAATYGVVGNIVTLIGTNFAERLMYLPSAFLVMAIATVLAKLPAKPRAVLVGIAMLVCSCRTFSVARDWNHPLVLYQHSLAATPKSIQVHLLLADEYRAHGDRPAADAALREACEMYPYDWRVWMHRAIAAMDDNDLLAARKDLDRAIKLKGDPLLITVKDRLEKLEAARKLKPVPPPKQP